MTQSQSDDDVSEAAVARSAAPGPVSPIVPDSDKLQSNVRAFFSSTAFTPYGVREWKRSLQGANTSPQFDSRGARSGGFLARTATSATTRGNVYARANSDSTVHGVSLTTGFELPPILVAGQPSAAAPPPITRPQRPVSSAGALRGHNHYRKIEDLSRFLHGDDTGSNTYYFKDAMERRLEREAEAQSAACYGRQEVLSMDRSDPRFAERAQCDTSDAQRRAKTLALPLRVTQFHQKFLETTALVRPYALGESHVHSMPVKPGGQGPEPSRRALDTFVMTMQCQRPTKGIAAPY